MTDGVELAGCGVHTMMHYLKALGILKILSEQKYKGIQSKWKNSKFYISAEENISKNDLVSFFQNQYVPTPMVTPWNRRSGFFEGNKKEGKNSGNDKSRDNLKEIESSNDPRLKNTEIQ